MSPLPSRVADAEWRPVARLAGHSAAILDLAYSVDGELLASASRDRTIRVWNTRYANLRQELCGHASSVSCVAWLAEPGFIASGSLDQSVIVWDRDGRVIQRVNHRAPIDNLAASPRRRLIAAAARDGSLHVVDGESGESVHRATIHDKRITALSWSRNDALLVSSSHDGSVKMWNADDWKLQCELRFEARVHAVAISPAGTEIVIAAGDERVLINDNEGRQQSVLEGHAGVVHAIGFSGNGQVLATQSGIDGTTYLWDVATWRRVAELRTSKYKSSASPLAMDRLGRAFASTVNRGQTIQIWSPVSPPEPQTSRTRRKAPVSLFYSYSHKDEALREQLETHLSLLKRQNVIEDWHDRRITAGSEWKGAIDENLEQASIILLLISADFLASDYCYDLEMKRAIERHERGEALVIPVILRTVDNWYSAPFGKLQACPRDGKAITSWPDRDAAFADVARAIRTAVESRDW